MSKRPHIFISYRRRQSSTDASAFSNRGAVGFGTQVSAHLYHWLISNMKKIFPQGATLFYDEQDNGDTLKGLYYKRIQEEMRNATHVLLILPSGALERCYAPDDEVRPHDVFGYEIRDALRKKNCTIIPIFVVENEDAVELGKNFTDAGGNIISDYSQFPEKFRKEAEERNLLELQRYAVPLRRDIVTGGLEDKNLARYWNDFFCLAKILEPSNSKGVLWVSIALLALAGGFGAYCFFDWSNNRNLVGKIESGIDSPEVKAVFPSDQGADGGSSGEPTPGESNPPVAQPGNEPPGTGPIPGPNDPPVPGPISRPGDSPAPVIKKASEAVIKKFHENLEILAYESEMESTAVEVKIQKAFAELEECLKYDLEASLINSQSEGEKQTLLHLAVKHKRLGLIRRLLEIGARSDIRNSWEETALDLAKESKDEETVRILSGS